MHTDIQVLVYEELSSQLQSIEPMYDQQQQLRSNSSVSSPLAAASVGATTLTEKQLKEVDNLRNLVMHLKYNLIAISELYHKVGISRHRLCLYLHMWTVTCIGIHMVCIAIAS